MSIEKEHGVPPDTAISLKMGNFNTPSVIHFFKKENSGFDFYIKTAIEQALYYIAAKTTVL